MDMSIVLSVVSAVFSLIVGVSAFLLKLALNDRDRRISTIEKALEVLNLKSQANEIAIVQIKGQMDMLIQRIDNVLQNSNRIEQKINSMENKLDRIILYETFNSKELQSGQYKTLTKE